MQRFSFSIESLKTVYMVLRPFNKQSHQIVCTIIFLRHFNFASQFSPLFLSVALFPSLEYYIYTWNIYIVISLAANTPHQPIRLSQLNGAIKMRLYSSEQFH